MVVAATSALLRAKNRWEIWRLRSTWKTGPPERTPGRERERERNNTRERERIMVGRGSVESLTAEMMKTMMMVFIQKSNKNTQNRVNLILY